MRIVYLNGQFGSVEQAKISVFDRGFLFGDGLYEVIPVFKNQMFRFQQHLERLKRGLQGLLFSDLQFVEELESIINELFTLNSENRIDGVYLQITRGAAPNRNHIIPKNIQPTVFICVMQFPQYTLEDKIRGVSTITCEDIRWQRCDLKTITLLANVLAKNEAHEKNADEAILIKNGYAIEASASNLFAVVNDTIVTAPANHEILGGISRDVIIEIIAAHQLPFAERKITVEELMSAQEVWLTSSTKDLMPVTTIDGKIVGSGQAGKYWHRVHNAFQALKP